MNKFIEITNDETGYNHKPVLVNVDYIFRVEPWVSSDLKEIGTTVFLSVKSCHGSPYQEIRTSITRKELMDLINAG